MEPGLEKFWNQNGVIDQKKLTRILSPVKQSTRIKAVPTPLERTTKQYPGEEIVNRSIQAFRSSAEQMKKYSQECWLVFEVLMSSGCRISEVLSIRAVDCMANGMVRIKGKKRSNDRIITCGGATDHIIRCRKLGVAPFQNVNRKFVWSVFKKFNIQLEVGSSGKKVVTHAIRHLVVASAKESQIDVNTTGSFIGHKNKSNTARYGKIK